MTRMKSVRNSSTSRLDLDLNWHKLIGDGRVLMYDQMWWGKGTPCQGHYTVHKDTC